MEVLEKCLKALINERADDIAFWVEQKDKKYIEHDKKIQEIFDKISHSIGYVGEFFIGNQAMVFIIPLCKTPGFGWCTVRVIRNTNSYCIYGHIVSSP